MKSLLRGAGLRLLCGNIVGFGLCTVRAGEPAVPLLPNTMEDMLTRRAQEEATTPFAIQAANGAVSEQTLWAHHFANDRPDELHPMGYNLLDRLARRQLDQGRGPCLQIYLQRSQEPGPVATLAAKRAELDDKRVKIISQYLAAAWPGVPFSVQVYDPHPIGMSGVEASSAYVNHRTTSYGYIPEGFRVAAASTKGDAPTGSGTLTPPMVTQTGTGGAGNLGAGTVIGSSGGPGVGGP